MAYLASDGLIFFNSFVSDSYSQLSAGIVLLEMQGVVNADELGLVLWCLLSHYQVWRKIFDLRVR